MVMILQFNREVLQYLTICGAEYGYVVNLSCETFDEQENLEQWKEIVEPDATLIIPIIRLFLLCKCIFHNLI